ncbi:MAG: hypothetical protein LBG83_04885 [Oscillospiraceae bacterium]|nr:hypothetical protein [Oscillospiraceae bacterium]
MEGYLITAVVLLGALVLAVYFYRRKREAETQARQSNTALGNFMATELMMKDSALNSYKAMMRQPLAGPPSSEFTWEAKPGRRRF